MLVDGFESVFAIDYARAKSGTCTLREHTDQIKKHLEALHLSEIPREHVEYASPLEAPSLKNLPDAYLEVADVDSLRDEGLAYGEALKKTGVEVQVHRTVGTPYGFEMVSKSSIVADSVEKRCAVLRKVFTK